MPRSIPSDEGMLIFSLHCVSCQLEKHSTELQPDDARIVDYDPSEELPPSLDAGVMEHYLDVGYVGFRIRSMSSNWSPSRTSSLRHDTLSDPKYEGARISRQQLSDEDEDGEDGPSSEGEEDLDVPEPLPKASSKRPSASKQLPPSSVAPSNGDENSTLRMVSTDDREKGKAVIHQIVSVILVESSFSLSHRSHRQCGMHY